MERRMISAGFVRDALDSLDGRDPSPLLALAGIADAGQPVTNLQYGQLWLAIAQMTGCEFFGQGARAMRPGSFALMGHAVLHAGTLERALRRALRFLNVVLDQPQGQLRARDGLAEVVLADARGILPAFAARAYWLILLGLMCWLIGRRIPLIQVDFAGPAPPDRQDYRQFFGAPVQFDQPTNRLVLAAHHLALPLIRGEAALKSFLRGAPGNILIRYRHDQGVAGRVRARLRATHPRTGPALTAWPATWAMRPPPFAAACAPRARALPPSAPRCATPWPAACCATRMQAWRPSRGGWAMPNRGRSTAPS